MNHREWSGVRLPGALREAKRLAGDLVFLDYANRRYRFVRVTRCGPIEVLGTGRSLTAALADVEIWLGLGGGGNLDGSR